MPLLSQDQIIKISYPSAKKKKETINKDINSNSIIFVHRLLLVCDEKKERTWAYY